MSELEFEVLDELYFIISFEALFKNVACSQEQLVSCLQDLLDKGWIKLVEPLESEQLTPESFNIVEDPFRYHYLATKEGLKAHNSI
jgi:hypothetical protein